jgi:hypothetical protein
VLAGQRAVIVVERDEVDRPSHPRGVEWGRGLAKGEVVHGRDPVEPGRTQRGRKPFHPTRKQVLVELHPVHVARQIVGSLGVEGVRRDGAGEDEPILLPGRRERRWCLVFVAQELSKEPDRIGVIILIVGTIAKVERSLVVDLEEYDRPRGVDEGCQNGPPLRETNALFPRGTRRSHSSAREKQPVGWATSRGDFSAYETGTPCPRQRARAGRNR